MSRPLADSAQVAAHLVDTGQRLSDVRAWTEAEACFRRAIEIDACNVKAHCGLGSICRSRGEHAAALQHYGQALRLAPAHRLARRNLATLLVQAGRIDDSLPLWCDEFAEQGGLAWMQGLITASLKDKDLSLAGSYASIVARLRWGADQASLARCGKSCAELLSKPGFALSGPKLRHDIGQMRYLMGEGLLDPAFQEVVTRYEQVLAKLLLAGEDARLPLHTDAARSLTDVYNRLLHVHEAPRAPHALSREWDAAAIEQQYLGNPPGVVCIDRFLSDEALDGLLRFCLASTIWSTNRYANGRLGAFFQDGFNCPLLLQIAEEIREVFPRMIGHRYPLRQLWGFKCGPYLPPAATTHADFAAVNVNFWITPDGANLDPSSGGLVIYDVDAPQHWDFETYNGRSDVIEPFLRRQRSRSITIPYRQNRAVIFNSDLFHGTDRVQFRPGYEHLRINITMLYGDREHDVDHRNLARPEPDWYQAGTTPAWRSAAFRRARGAWP